MEITRGPGFASEVVREALAGDSMLTALAPPPVEALQIVPASAISADYDLYVHDIPALNITMLETRRMMRFLLKHGIFAGRPLIEMVPQKDQTTPVNRSLAFDQALTLGFAADVPYFVTVQIGASARHVAAYLLEHFRENGTQSVIQELYALHIDSTPAGWSRHLLSLPNVREAVNRNFPKL